MFLDVICLPLQENVEKRQLGALGAAAVAMATLAFVPLELSFVLMRPFIWYWPAKINPEKL